MQFFRALTLAFALIFGFNSAVIADQSSNGEADYLQSQKCAGALSIMTALGFWDETAPIYKHFSNLSNFHFSLISFYVSQQIDNSTMGDVGRSVSKGVVIVDDEMIRDPNSLQETVKYCLSWLHGVTLYFQEQDPATPELEVMKAMPRSSNNYEYPHSDWEPMIPVVEAAYDLWLGANQRDYHRCYQDYKNTKMDCMLASE